MFLKTTKEVRCLDIKYAENNVVINPTDRVTANPLMGPEPNTNNIIDAIRVVIFASSIVTIDFLKPKSKACILEFSFLVSSLIRSNIRTLASTAIPTVKIMPAIPGKVNVASNKVKIPISINKLEISEIFAIIPKYLYFKIIKIITKIKPTTNETAPASIES